MSGIDEQKLIKSEDIECPICYEEVDVKDWCNLNETCGFCCDGCGLER
jgi:hypothetical protein